MEIKFNPAPEEKGIGLSALVRYHSPEFMDAMSKIVDLAEFEEITAIEVQRDGIVVRIGIKNELRNDRLKETIYNNLIRLHNICPIDADITVSDKNEESVLLLDSNVSLKPLNVNQARFLIEQIRLCINYIDC